MKSNDRVLAWNIINEKYTGVLITINSRDHNGRIHCVLKDVGGIEFFKFAEPEPVNKPEMGELVAWAREKDKHISFGQWRGGNTHPILVGDCYIHPDVMYRIPINYHPNVPNIQKEWWERYAERLEVR